MVWLPWSCNNEKCFQNRYIRKNFKFKGRWFPESGLSPWINANPDLRVNGRHKTVPCGATLSTCVSIEEQTIRTLVHYCEPAHCHGTRHLNEKCSSIHKWGTYEKIKPHKNAPNCQSTHRCSVPVHVFVTPYVWKRPHFAETECFPITRMTQVFGSNVGMYWLRIKCRSAANVWFFLLL